MEPRTWRHGRRHPISSHLMVSLCGAVRAGDEAGARPVGGALGNGDVGGQLGVDVRQPVAPDGEHVGLHQEEVVRLVAQQREQRVELAARAVGVLVRHRRRQLRVQQLRAAAEAARAAPERAVHALQVEAVVVPPLRVVQVQRRAQPLAARAHLAPPPHRLEQPRHLGLHERHDHREVRHAPVVRRRAREAHRVRPVRGALFVDGGLRRSHGL
jgi:hypothetical protein